MNQFVSKWLFSTNHKDIGLSGYSISLFMFLYSIAPFVLRLILYLVLLINLTNIQVFFFESVGLYYKLRYALLLLFVGLGLIVYLVIYWVSPSYIEPIKLALMPPSVFDGFDLLVFKFGGNVRLNSCNFLLNFINTNRFGALIYNVFKFLIFCAFPIVNLSLLVLFLFNLITNLYLSIIIPLAFLIWVARLLINSFEGFIQGSFSVIRDLVSVSAENDALAEDTRTNVIVTLTSLAVDRGFTAEDIPILTERFIYLTYAHVQLKRFMMSCLTLGRVINSMKAVCWVYIAASLLF